MPTHTKRFNKTSLITAISCAALIGCWSIDIDVDKDLESTVTIELDLQGPCSGSGQQGDATYTKTIETVDDVQVCRVDINWAGDMVDMPEVRQKVEEEAAKRDFDPNDTQITEITLDITDVRIRDANGSPLPAPLTYFATDLSIANLPVFNMESTSSDALLANPIALTIPDALIDAFQRAFEQNTAVGASTITTLRVPMESLATLQSAPGPIVIEIDSKAVVTATVEKSVL